MNTLAVEKRSELGKRAKTLRKDGNIPAVVYGPKQKSVPITISLKDFEIVLKEAGESSVVSLTGLEKPLSVLIHDVDHDPVTSIPRHVDFYAIEKGAKVIVAVPLVFVGESPAVKAGANLVKVLHEVEVEAEATHLMHELTIDISKVVAIGDSVHASDISLGAHVTLITEPNEVVVIAQEVEEDTSGATEAPDIANIEVEKKGKQEDASAESAS